MTRDLVEEVARELFELAECEPVSDKNWSRKEREFWSLDARAAIAIVLKRAAEVAVTAGPAHYTKQHLGLSREVTEMEAHIATAILSLGEQEGRENG